MWRFGSVENPIFLATTDFPFPQRFDIDTLDTLELLRPANALGTRSGSTHWMREPGTDNSLYYQYKTGNFFQSDYVEVQRFRPDNTDYSKPEVIATFEPRRNSMVHSFSVTENHAIFLYYHVYIDASATCMAMNHFHAMECTRVKISTSFIKNSKINHDFSI